MQRRHTKVAEGKAQKMRRLTDPREDSVEATYTVHDVAVNLRRDIRGLLPQRPFVANDEMHPQYRNDQALSILVEDDEPFSGRNGTWSSRKR
jgi:hypothetical protein